MCYRINHNSKKHSLRWIAAVGFLLAFFSPVGAVMNSEQLTMKVYNEEDYQLGYQTFVGSGSLVEAWRVAKSAVQQQPDNMQWRQRLAQLSEWTDKPQEAYSQWQFIYSNDKQNTLAREALLRLSPASGNKEMTLAMWLSRHTKKGLTPAQTTELMGVFEHNNQAEAGVAFFKRHYEQNHNPYYLAAAARLEQRLGHDRESEEDYERLLSNHPAQTDWIISAVILYMRQNNTTQALKLMQTYQAQIPDTQTLFWQLMGDLSWLQQQDKVSVYAYKKLSQQKVLAPIQRERLFALLERYYPEEAVNLSYSWYQQQKDSKSLLKLLSYLVQQQDWVRFSSVLAGVSASDLKGLEQNANFLLLRGQYLTRSKQQDKAKVDMTNAYKIGRNDVNIVAQILWHYIDQRDIPMVKDLLSTHAQRALTESALWAPFAAAYHELDDIPQAIAFYQKQLTINPNDPLWMLNYADAIARSGQIGLADRVRHQAWALLAGQKNAAKEPVLPLSRDPRLLAYANLTLQNLTGDGANKYMQRIVTRLRDLDDKSQDDQQTNDLILSWAINNNATPAAKLWLIGRYGAHYRSQSPLWGETNVALNLNDTQAISKLNEQSDSLPPYDRHDIARALEFEGQAAKIAFENMEGNPTDNPMHERYVSSYLKQANLVGMQMDMMKGDSLTRTGGIVYTSLRVSPHWHVGVEVGQYDITKSSDSLYADVVGHNSLAGLSLTYDRARYQLSAAVRQQQRLENWVSAEVQGRYNWSDNLTLSGSMRYHAPNRDTTPMSLAGMEDVLQASATYSITARDYVRLSTQLAEYRTQTEQYLGSGTHADWEVGHRIRTEYPDWNIRLLGAHRRYSRDGAADARSLSVFSDPTQQFLAGNRASSALFLPADVDYYALCAGAGQYFSERRNLDGTSYGGRYYSKAWRPLAEVCATYNSASQTAGYSGMAGVRGTIAGEDQVLIVYQESNGGLQLPNQTLRALSAKYERLF